MSAGVPSPERRVLVAHPSADRYGSDLQLVESIRGLVDDGWRVTLVLPSDGPLIGFMEGVDVRIRDFAVLRKSALSPTGLLALTRRTLRDLISLRRLIREVSPHLVYANTITVPSWMLVARMCGIPVLTHVHEAEDDHPRLVRLALAAPLLMCKTIVVNSRASLSSLTAVLPRLGSRTHVVYNGVPDPGDARTESGPPWTLAYVGRLSPRKGVDTALAAVAHLVSQGLDVTLDVCGSTFPGYEGYEDELRARAAADDLRGRVHFRGYVRPVADVLSRAHVLVMPSRYEPFGNVAAEALLARCPIVATRVQGLAEVVQDRVTGILVAADEPERLAQAVAEVLLDPESARARSAAGRQDALDRFSLSAYRRAITGHARGAALPC